MAGAEFNMYANGTKDKQTVSYLKEYQSWIQFQTLRLLHIFLLERLLPIFLLLNRKLDTYITVKCQRGGTNHSNLQMGWRGKGYVLDYSLWLRDAGHKSAPFKNANTVLYNGTIDITGKNMTVIWRDGFAFGDGVANVDKADLSPGIDVETTSDIKSLYDPISSSYIPDSGVEMTKYCTACHTDYMKDPLTGEVGVLTSVTNTQRHTGVTDQMTCVRCHFAHGTKSDIMKDSSGNIATTPDSLSSTAHSSALRSFVDWESCYSSGCHSKTIGDPLYLDVTD